VTSAAVPDKPPRRSQQHDERGDMLAEFGADETGVLVATLDLAQAKRHRAAFGFFRDRRPELYGRLTEDV
jgi:N-carbamoylputrescine amidase